MHSGNIPVYWFIDKNAGFLHCIGKKIPHHVNQGNNKISEEAEGELEIKHQETVKKERRNSKGMKNFTNK